VSLGGFGSKEKPPKEKEKEKAQSRIYMNYRGTYPERPQG
jgi:hypothetical protein